MRTDKHATSNSSMRSSTGRKTSRAHGSPLELPFPPGSSAPARQQHRQRSDIGARAAERAGWAGAGSQAREGSPRGRRPPSYAPMSSPSPHLALDDGTCDTSVPTVRARQGKGMQLLDTCPDRPLARATFRLRRSEKKILSHERYTQLRNGAARALVAFPVVSHLLPLHQLS